MKRINDIFKDVISLENLEKASIKAKKNKNKIEEVEYFDKNKEILLKKLQKSLINKTFTTSKYKIFQVNDNGKTREIFDLPFYPDRIVHWALMLQIDNILRKTFIFDSYAAIPNKGGHKALKRARKWLIEFPQDTKYCLKIDVKKYFPNINQDVLSSLVRKIIKDKDVLWLIDDIIYSTESGLPIGNYTSQYFGNFYLTYFDHYCKEDLKLRHMQRYMDDYVFYNSSKDYLYKCKLKMDKYLSDNLKLKIKDNWRIFETKKDGVDFVGFRNFGEYVLLRKTICKNFKYKMKKISNFASKEGYITTHHYISINSYMGWLKWCNSYNLYKKYIKPLQKYLNKYKEEINESTIKTQT